VSRIIEASHPQAPTMAAAVIARGELIVLPTDTVYGVGAAIEEAAIERLFVAKRRPAERAIPVLLADLDDVWRVAREFPPQARRLAEAFWPGPLTLALPKRDDLPPNLTQLPTVGVRVPDLPEARAILAAAGGALAVSSANRSDQPPACTIQAAVRYLGDAVALYLDGGTCRGGVPSTVVTFEDGELRVVRAGPLSEADLRAVLG
jgi:L-threonylcarbamoyladenylate synthase